MTIPCLENPAQAERPYGYGPLTDAMVSANDALLASFAATSNHSEYWARYALVEQAMNKMSLSYFPVEAERIRVAKNRINRALKPMLDAQYSANKTYSFAELMARAEVPTTHNEAA